jgi:chromosome segregation ATPase
MEFVICDVYDEYAIVRNLSENIFERVYYTKNDENDSLEITKKERCYIVDVTEEEKTALDNLHTAAGATFSAISENFTTMTETIATLNTNVEGLNATITEHLTSIEGLNTRIGEYDCQISELNNQISEFNTKIAEHETTISTLTTERDELSVSLNTANSTIEEVNAQLATANENLTVMTTARDTAIAERDTLAAFKQTVINEQKKAIITSYNAQLPVEVIDGYLTNLDNYALEQLDMLLTYEVKKFNPTIFSANPVVTPIYIPKDDSGAARSLNDILAKYEK